MIQSKVLGSVAHLVHCTTKNVLLCGAVMMIHITPPYVSHLCLITGDMACLLALYRLYVMFHRFQFSFSSFQPVLVV